MNMSQGKIYVAGIGPGSRLDITPAVTNAISESQVVIGYKYYFDFVQDFILPDTKCIDTGMRKEKDRAKEAFNYAEQGNVVTVISSGDAGIYGMAPLLFEMRDEKRADIEIVTLPGISAFQKAASILGAPIGHDTCIISMSDLLTPWSTIEKRIEAAAWGDFVTCVYNPKSKNRYWQLERLIDIFKQFRSGETPIGVVRQAGRDEESFRITTLDKFTTEDVDMFTIVIIGNSQSYVSNNRYIVTPRGYYSGKKDRGQYKLGQSIMIESFKTIRGELSRKDYPLGYMWSLLHAIHTTADFDMENILYTDDEAVENLFNLVQKGQLKTIITDVTMVVSGIRKGALERLNIEAKCYLHHPDVSKLAKEENITRTQAGIRLAVKEHPDALFVFGNAPTALMELCQLIRKGKAEPSGVIAAPVGFVNVRESKYMIKSFKDVTKIIIEGRKGGSNLAATLVNSILTFDDAAQLEPGKDV